MNYIKATFHLDTEEFIKDIFINNLAEIGFDSFEQTSLGVIGYCQENIFDENSVRQVIDDLISTPQIKFRIDKIEDKNWNEIWEQNSLKPININNKVFIHSSKEKTPQKFDYEIIINPKQSFGTGGHETTEMIISKMLKMNFEEKSVLDLGCGTAVLAILAAKMGAKNVVAVDVDRWAIENAIENITENQIVVETILGDINSVKERKFDVIFANITRNILLDLIPLFCQMIENTTCHCGQIPLLWRGKGRLQSPENKGTVILSGFLEQDIKIIEEKANQNNLYISDKKTKNEWAMTCLVNSE